jgi:hypothetical protein
MFNFMFVVNFIGDIFKKLGIIGTLFILLIVLTAVQHHLIDNRDATIAARNMTISTQLKLIETQNASIKEANRQFNILKDQLSAAESKNKIISLQFDTLRQNLNQKPIAQTCKGAMEEVRNAAKDNADRWNAK